VIVDEAQDLSPLQWKAFWTFARNAQRIYLAGDDDQAIYEWAGASPDVFLGQSCDVVEILPRSYRCPRRVTDLAHRLVREIAVRQPKDWQPREEDGHLAYCETVDQLNVSPTGSVLMLYRNHKFAPDVINHLKSSGEPFLTGHLPSIPAMSAGAILTWEDLRKGRATNKDGLEAVFSLASMRRISQTARDCVRRFEDNDGITARALVASGCWADTIFNLPWFQVLDRLKDEEFYLRKVVQKYGRAGLTSEPRIRLSTIHGVKGAEADHVYLLTAMSRMVQQSLETEPDSERRVWYVGVTRAKQSLTLVGMDNPLF
jgi:DNA helicase-2/ATP-dependent DNA helicase PcrA